MGRYCERRPSGIYPDDPEFGSLARFLMVMLLATVTGVLIARSRGGSGVMGGLVGFFGMFFALYLISKAGLLLEDLKFKLNGGYYTVETFQNER